MKKLLVAILAGLVLSGCGALLSTDQAQKVMRNAEGLINDYCDEVPAADRALLREDINDKLDPRSIVIDCAVVEE